MFAIARIDSLGSAFGAEAGFGVNFPFTHNQLPFRKRAVFLRLVSTLGKALDYAAGGFHVSVDRGSAGGCEDPFETHKGGSVSVPCQFPRNRDDIRQMWSQAAGRYVEAFKAAQIAGTPLDSVRAILADANNLADQAYKAEGIEPPRDPATGTIEPPVSKRSLIGYVPVALPAAAALFGIWKEGFGGDAAGLMGFGRRRKRR